jgi:hypothetical protein
MHAQDMASLDHDVAALLIVIAAQLVLGAAALLACSSRPDKEPDAAWSMAVRPGHHERRSAATPHGTQGRHEGGGRSPWYRRAAAEIRAVWQATEGPGSLPQLRDYPVRQRLC